MDELTINSEYMRRLIQKLRAVMAPEDEVMPDAGGKPSDDPISATMQETPGDLRLEELREEIDSLDADHKHELVALTWLGRGDFQAAEWQDALTLAEQRHEGPTSSYLLSHPLVADHLANGLEELGYGHVLLDGSY